MAEKLTKAQRRLPPGQAAIMRSFAKHGADSIYVASDIMDLRVCWAMVERGLLARFEEVPAGYELSPAGRLALQETAHDR